ncbi:MAG: ATP-binding protein [Bacteroidetes bacterium]|nr:ATP-binding protein [Bacteroidota bacterium]
MEKIKFLDYWMPNYNRNDFQNILIENTISLWKLERERLSSFASHVQQFFENTFFKGKDLLPLNIAIAEACNNILDHSESKAGGFILTQYYKKDDLLIVSICDFGVGIPKKINDFRAKNNEPKLKPCKAIEKALEKKYTTKSAPHNAGLGLDNIFSNVKETKGRLLIVSKNGCISKRIGETDVEEEMKAQFPGTHLVISLGTKALNEKEKEIAEEIDLF